MTTHSSSSRLVTLVDRYPAGSFFVLTFALSWGFWLPAMTAELPLPDMLVVIPGAFGPGFAAAVVTRVRGESVGAWLGDSFAWRRPRRWYALAFALPVAISAAVLGVLVAVTGTVEGVVVDQALTLFGLNLVIATLVGGGQEEFGWRGFALPHLQTRFDALTASLIIGVVWALWHAPMFAFGIYGEDPALYALGVIAFAVVFTWYYNSSGGCLPGAILMHGATNASVNVPPMLVGGPEAIPVPYIGLIAGGFWVVALLSLARGGRSMLSTGSKVLPTWTGSDDDGHVSTVSSGGTPGVSD